MHGCEEEKMVARRATFHLGPRAQAELARGVAADPPGIRGPWVSGPGPRV